MTTEDKDKIDEVEETISVETEDSAAVDPDFAVDPEAPGPSEPAPNQQGQAEYVSSTYVWTGTPQAAPAVISPAEPPKETGIRVGLLVWAATLIVIGLVMITVSVAFAASLQAVLVSFLGAAGIAFLVLAFVTGKQKPAART